MSLRRYRLALMLLLPSLPLLAGCATATGSQDTSQSASFRGFVLSSPVQVPELALTDSTGARIDLARRLRGHVTLLYVGYTRCPDLCPLVMASITRAVAELSEHERSQVQVVFVTADPVHDRPAVLARWLSNFNPQFLGVTGSTAQLRPVYAALGMPPPAVQSGPQDTVEHAADAYAFDPTGRAQLAYDDTSGPADYVHDLRLLLDGKQPHVPDDPTLATTGGVGRAGLLGLFDVFLHRSRGGSATLSFTVSNGGSADVLLAASVDGTAAHLGSRADAPVSIPAGPALTSVGGHTVRFPAGAVRPGAIATVLLRFRDSATVILRVPVTP